MRSDILQASILVGIGLVLPATLPAQEPIRIFAAASLTDALVAVVSGFEMTHPSSRVVAQFGGSSDLARQILAGAPADLFFSADRHQLDRVAARGLIAGGEHADVLSNQLVIVGQRNGPDTVDKPEDLAALARIAMADPEAVPAGVYARRYLESQGLWSRLRTRVVPTLDVRGALAAVASGNIDAGFVYRTDASMETRVKILYTVPREVGPPIFYSLGIVQRSQDRERRDARALYRYVTSEAAGKVFKRFGFIFLEPEPQDQPKTRP